MDPVSFGQYTVIRRLGSGGMADVYLARDPSLGREVAVKSPNLEIAGDDILNRFVVEAKAIAQLEHPAIVPLYEYGRQDGRPYLVMRYMRGGSLADRIAQRPLSLPEAATIVDRVGDALDYAHAHGILHRDVKPGNILFDDRGAAYLSDFGIARMIGGGDDMTVYKLTRTGFIVGTFEYISPEQVIGRTNLDGRSDLYSLGVVIYEMLTGQLPYHDSSPHLLAAQHVRDPIPLIRSVRPDLPQTADQFIRYALAKEPEGRYQTGATLAIGLRSVAPPTPATPQARPKPEPKAKPAPKPKPEPKPKPPPKPRPAPRPNPLPKLWSDFRQRAGSLLKRPTGQFAANPADLPGSIFLSLVILLGFAGLSLFMSNAVNQRGGRSSSAPVTQATQTSRELAIITPQNADRLTSLHDLGDSDARDIIFSPDSRRLAVNKGKAVAIYDLTTAQPAVVNIPAEGTVSAMAFSPDGTQVAVGLQSGAIEVRSTASREGWLTIKIDDGPIISVAFSPNGTMLAAGLGHTTWLKRADNGKHIAILRGSHTSRMTHLAFSPDGRGRFLARASDDGTVQLWHTTDGAQQATLMGTPSAPVTGIVFSPGGKLLAAASSNVIRLWRIPSGELVATLADHSDTVTQIAFSPDGKILASSSNDNTVRLWTVSTNGGSLLDAITDHSNDVLDIAFSPNGQLLASASRDRTVRLWNMADRKLVVGIQGNKSAVTQVAFSPDGKRLATLIANGQIEVWGVPSAGTPAP